MMVHWASIMSLKFSFQRAYTSKDCAYLTLLETSWARRLHSIGRVVNTDGKEYNAILHANANNTSTRWTAKSVSMRTYSLSRYVRAPSLCMYVLLDTDVCVPVNFQFVHSTFFFSQLSLLLLLLLLFLHHLLFTFEKVFFSHFCWMKEFFTSSKANSIILHANWHYLMN